MAMGKVNLGRVILGGLLAGLVINISEFILNTVVVGAQMEELLKARSMPPIGNSAIATFILFGFLLGILTIWLYAAIRPRYGAGPGSAIMAGLIVFFLAYVYSNAGLTLLGFMPASMMLVIDAWWHCVAFNDWSPFSPGAGDAVAQN
jgi:hypothetical protein